MSWLKPNSQKGFSTVGGYTINNKDFGTYDGILSLRRQWNMLEYSPIQQNAILQEAYNKGYISDGLVGRLNSESKANDSSNIMREFLGNNAITGINIKQKDDDVMQNFLNIKQNNPESTTSAQEANRALGITNGVFQGLGALTNAGLGIWGAIESNKNLKKQREVADKQIALAQEQIDASREYRQQRRDEIARLNRVRSNTSKAFNTGSVITRSY